MLSNKYHVYFKVNSLYLPQFINTMYNMGRVNQVMKGINSCQPHMASGLMDFDFKHIFIYVYKVTPTYSQKALTYKHSNTHTSS